MALGSVVLLGGRGGAGLTLVGTNCGEAARGDAQRKRPITHRRVDRRYS